MSAVVWRETSGSLWKLCPACANGKHADHAPGECQCDLDAEVTA